jgi:hypothetical protein
MWIVIFATMVRRHYRRSAMRFDGKTAVGMGR